MTGDIFTSFDTRVTCVWCGVTARRYIDCVVDVFGLVVDCDGVTSIVTSSSRNHGLVGAPIA